MHPTNVCLARAYYPWL